MMSLLLRVEMSPTSTVPMESLTRRRWKLAGPQAEARQAPVGNDAGGIAAGAVDQAVAAAAAEAVDHSKSLAEKARRGCVVDAAPFFIRQVS
jgi:hypothetical protein